MIYSPNNNEPLVLVEEAADSFLKSVGVKLYEDEISINGTLYEGSYGEEILAENGIFLYEDGIVLEGKQAEEYKARKAAEKDKNNWTSPRTKKMVDSVLDNRNDDGAVDRGFHAIKILDREHKRRSSAHDSNIKDVKRLRNSYDASDKNKRDGLRNAVGAARTSDRNLSNIKNQDNMRYAYDSIVRHDRRHANKKHNTSVQHNSTIFSDVEII